MGKHPGGGAANLSSIRAHVYNPSCSHVQDRVSCLGQMSPDLRIVVWLRPIHPATHTVGGDWVNLHEYQSKRIFANYGIPIPRGEVAATPADARSIANRLGGAVVVKSQVLVGGRGKAGGIRLAATPDAAEEAADTILGMEIKGLAVRKVLVDQAADIQSEIYLGVVLDRAQGRVVSDGEQRGRSRYRAGSGGDARSYRDSRRTPVPRPP